MRAEQTSAKTNVNVIQAFETLAQAALREKYAWTEQS